MGLVLALLLSAVEAPAYRFTVSAGFSHWYGTFGAPIGITTPALTLGFVPLSWLEVQAQYTLMVVEQPMPDGSSSRVGFATLLVLVRKELEAGGQRLVLGCGPMAGMVHTGRGVREVLGVGFLGRYLIALGEKLSIGPFLDVRAAWYRLPESARGFLGHNDAQLQLGVAAAF